MLRRALRSAVLLTLPCALAAQQPTRPVPPPRVDDSPFRRLEMPAPSALRTASGAPGHEYWQQRVDYVIRAELDTAAHRLRGEEVVTYHNRSPDTLRYLWLQLDQNLYRRDSRGAHTQPPNTRFGPRDAEGGMTIDRVATAAGAGRPGRPLGHVVSGTMMKVDLPAPLAPGGRFAFEVAWSFPFAFEITNRMGLERVDDGVIYEVAQWYPRLAVYDDLRGWNPEQYLGQGEFYLEYGSFQVSLTVPANMLVAATGTLQNPLEVLTAAQRARLARARRSDETIVIRGKDEIADPASRPPSATGTHTWRFAADSVRDFAWAAAKHFIWDAARVNEGRTLAMSFYPPSADSIWKESTQYAKTAIERYSQQWSPYPYPVAINVNGVEGGMEYPMIVFCGNRTNAQALYSVTDHEFGHTWFPMVVGSNERLYPWMDEGFNTFMNYYNWRAKYPDAPNRRGNTGAYVAFALSGQEQPALTPADRTFGLGAVAYNKPAVGLIWLRDEIVGPELFDPAFREYIRRWSYKHPTPWDFFRTMEDGIGEDLSWFWRSWFFTTETLDLAVDSVAVVRPPGRPEESRVLLRRSGPMVAPLTLELTYADATRERRRLPVEIWYRGERYLLRVPGRVVEATIDPDQATPDVNRANDRWRAPAAPQP